MGHRSALCRAGFLLLCPLILAAGHAQETVVLGPIEKVNQAGSTLTVLGQTFHVTSTATVAVGGKRYKVSDALQLVHLGAYTSVIGTDDQSGLPIAKEILISNRPYIPGANDVFISGVVTSYNALTGQAKLGNLKIDATSMFASNSSFAVAVGSRIEVFGKQAVEGGVVWASELKLADDASVQSISGTGIAGSKQSISGTGGSVSTQSISGTGVARSTQSISGTGVAAQSISGTGGSVSTQSISGTGVALSTQSISGTGAASSVQSISGTGKGTLIN